MSTEQEPIEDRLAHGYEKMAARARELLSQAKKEALPNIQDLLDRAQDKAVNLEELTREEAEKIGEYLSRDLRDAALYLSYTGKGLADWLHFDRDMVEARMMEAFSSMVDHTKLELEALAERANEADDLHTGEITGPATLACTDCDSVINFHKVGRIPPCPKCHHTSFRRTNS